MTMLKAAIAALTFTFAVATALPAQALDIAAPGTEGFKILVSNTDDVIATYRGTTAAFNSDLFLVNSGQQIFNNQATPVGTTFNLGSYAVGTELVFRLLVNTTGNEFFTGPGSRNSDGFAHARVQSNWQPGESLVSFEDLENGPFEYNDLSFSFTNTAGAVPEAATWLMLLCGIGAIGTALRRRGAERLTPA